MANGKMARFSSFSQLNIIYIYIYISIYIYIDIYIYIYIIFSCEKEENLAILPFAIHNSIDGPEGHSVQFSSVA